MYVKPRVPFSGQVAKPYPYSPWPPYNGYGNPTYGKYLPPPHAFHKQLSPFINGDRLPEIPPEIRGTLRILSHYYQRAYRQLSAQKSVNTRLRRWAKGLYTQKRKGYYT